MLAATYSYDAWGNVIAGADYSGMNIRAINPFRYRSYYYDTETGLYYLNSRYYDPETGRFINADDTKYLDPETLGGLSLYAYCLNNPVMYADPTGYALETVLDIGFSFWSLMDFINEPSLINFVWLAVDVACLAIPFIPSIGGSKVITKADDIVDAVEFVKKHDEVIVIGQTMSSRVIPYADEIGATIYKGVNNNTALEKTFGYKVAAWMGYFHNMGYIISHSMSGAKFIDKGFDAARSIKKAKAGGKIDLFIERMSRFTIYSEKFFAQLFSAKNILRVRYSLFD